MLGSDAMDYIRSVAHCGNLNSSIHIGLAELLGHDVFQIVMTELEDLLSYPPLACFAIALCAALIWMARRILVLVARRILSK